MRLIKKMQKPRPKYLLLLLLCSFDALLVLHKDHSISEVFFQLFTCTQRAFLGAGVCFRVQYIYSVCFSL